MGAVRQLLEVPAKTIPIVDMFCRCWAPLTLVEPGVVCRRRHLVLFPRSKFSRYSASTRATALRRVNAKLLFKPHGLLRESLGFGISRVACGGKRLFRYLSQAISTRKQGLKKYLYEYMAKHPCVSVPPYKWSPFIFGYLWPGTSRGSQTQFPIASCPWLVQVHPCTTSLPCSYWGLGMLGLQSKI